jgi:hypothetical protein
MYSQSEHSTSLQSATTAIDAANSLSLNRVSIDKEARSSDVIPFPKPFKKRWVCNLSSQFRFIKHSPYFLQIAATSSNSQFDMICKLLQYNTCDTIYFDQHFTLDELNTIRALQSRSRTSLINAKQAYLLNKTYQGYA